jgi:hypothetical protein
MAAFEVTPEVGEDQGALALSMGQAIRLLESRAFSPELQPRCEGNELICQIESLEVRSIRTCGNRLRFARHSSGSQAQQRISISCRRSLVS